MNNALKGLGLSKEETVFAARVEELCRLCDRNNVSKLSGFLDLRQQKISEYTACGISPDAFSFYGGYEGAERKMFGVFPDYIQDRLAEFPISFIKISHPRPLTHRDFLGGLMSLGIKREIIGDILVGEENSFIILQTSMCDYVLDNVSKIGNVGVTLTLCNADEVVLSENRFEEKNVIVSSMRLDCVVSAFVNKSRSESEKLISSERVVVNNETITSCCKNVSEGDVISIRSFGKYIVGPIGSKTKKGRLVLSYKKYI